MRRSRPERPPPSLKKGHRFPIAGYRTRSSRSPSAGALKDLHAEPKRRGLKRLRPLRLRELGQRPASSKADGDPGRRFGPYVTDGETNANLCARATTCCPSPTNVPRSCWPTGAPGPVRRRPAKSARRRRRRKAARGLTPGLAGPGPSRTGRASWVGLVRRAVRRPRPRPITAFRRPPHRWTAFDDARTWPGSNSLASW